jgi:hypothetical protein
MEYVLLFAFSVLVALGFNFAGPRFSASSFGTRFQSSYARRTLGTAIVLFVAIVVASFVMSAAYKKPMLPSA